MKLEKNIIKKIVELAEFDKKYIKIQKEFKKIENEKSNFNIEINNFNQIIEDKKDIEHKALKITKSIELNLKDLEEQLKIKSETLNKVENKKEFESINKEMNEIEDKTYFQEKNLIESTNKHNKIKTELDLLKKQNESEISSINEKIKETDKKIKSLESDLQNYETIRKDKIKDLPLDFLEIYDSIKFKTMRPLSKLVNDYCDECFFVINLKDIQLLKRNYLLSCKNCYRLIYYDPEPKEIIEKDKKFTNNKDEKK